MVQNKIRKNQITREKIRKNKMKLENNYLLCCCLESVGIGNNEMRTNIFSCKPTFVF